MEKTTIQQSYKLYDLPKIINNVFEKRHDLIYIEKKYIQSLFFQTVFKNYIEKLIYVLFRIITVKQIKQNRRDYNFQ